jgi:hypothetical protein
MPKESLNITKLRLLWLVVLLLCAFSDGLAQDRVLVGPYDAAHVNGLVFITPGQTPAFFGLRLLVYRPGELLEAAPPLERIALWGPHALDGSYVRLHWRSPFEGGQTITLQYCRPGPRIVVGQLSAPANVRVALEAYRPWSEAREAASVNFQTQNNQIILGEQVGNQKPRTPLSRFILRTDRAGEGAASYNDAAAMHKLIVREGKALTPSEDVFGVQPYSALTFELQEHGTVGFVALLGDDFEDLERDAERLLQVSVTEWLERMEENYEAAQGRSGGWLAEGLEALSRTVAWNRIWLPEQGALFAAALRANGATPPNAPLVLGWDAFFRALTAVLVDGETAKASLRVLLEGQLPDGRVPLRAERATTSAKEAAVSAGRSAPPLGAFCIWKVYLATQDLELLGWAYPRLKRWNEWWTANRGDGQAWRDGNGDGLLEWGFDPVLEYGELGARRMPAAVKAQHAAAESGFADSPQWESAKDATKDAASAPEPAKYNEKAGTLELTPVGLNALYALDLEILALMARELGLKADADKLQERYLKLKTLLDEKLWSEEDGLYLNRHWDGQFSRRLTPDLFFVLAAGLPASDRAQRMLEKLRDEKKFGGEFILPSVARDDPAFTQAGYWRGRVWAPLNYLVQVGLKRYGFYNEAAELALRSTSLAREAWWREGKVYDNFSSVDGRGGSAAETPRGLFQAPSFGPLMWLPGLEEVLDTDPWSGLAVGSAAAVDEAVVEQLRLGGASFTVTVGPERLTIARDGENELSFDGPARLRGFRASERTINFYVETVRELQARVPMLGAREISVSVDGKVIGKTAPGRPARFTVKAGIHRVLIVK